MEDREGLEEQRSSAVDGPPRDEGDTVLQRITQPRHSLISQKAPCQKMGGGGTEEEGLSLSRLTLHRPERKAVQGPSQEPSGTYI